MPAIALDGSGGGLTELPAEEVVADYRARLESLTVGQMRELAAHRRIKVSGSRRGGILQSLAAGLADPENLTEAVQRLSTGAHLVLDMLLIMGQNLEREYTRKTVPGWLNSALAGRNKPQKMEELLDELALSGLIFLNGPQMDLPKAVMAIREQNPDLVKLYPEVVAETEKTRPGEFLHQVLWLSLLCQAKSLDFSVMSVKMDYGGWPTNETVERLARNDDRLRLVASIDSFLKPEVLKRLGPVMGQPAEKIDYAARILEQAGFLSGKPPKKLTPVFSRWLQEGFERQNLVLMQAVKDLGAAVEMDLAQALGEFNIFRDSFTHFTYLSFTQSLTKARQIFFKILQFLPGDEWIDAESFLGLVHGLLPEFPLDSFTSHPLTLALKDGVARPTNYTAWRKSYGLFYQAILQGPAQWLGICETAYQGRDLIAFKKTSFGDFLLGSCLNYSFEPAPSTSASISFGKDDLIQLNPAEATPELIGLIMQLGTLDTGYHPVKEFEAHSPLQLIGYRLEKGGLSRIFEAGWTGETLIQALTQASQVPLPHPVEDRIRTCWQHFGRLHVYTDLALIQFGDDFCLPELLAGTRLGRSMLYQFNPHLIAVRAETVDDLLNELRSKGYTPRVMEQHHG